MATPTREPIQINAGDTISFTKLFADYSAADGWTLTYSLLAGPVPITFVAVANGAEFDITVADTVTANWIPDEYLLIGFVEKSGERYEVYSGTLLVKENPETAEVMPTTHAQRMLAKLEAVLEGKASDDILDSEIEGTIIRRMPFSEIYKLRAKYRRERQGEIATENARNGRPTGRKVVTRLAVTFPTNSPYIGAGPMFSSETK